MDRSRMLRLSLFALCFCCWLCGSSSADSRFVPDDRPRRGAAAQGLIVFVHGLGGDDRETWTNGTTYWPALVAEEFPNFDVHVYKYTSAPTIGELGRRLSDHLTDKVKLSEYRKVIFVAHSLGGLVTREYLSQDRNHHNLIAGLIFLSTPSGGSDYANLGALLSTTVDQMRTLSAASSYLNTFADAWTNARPPLKFRTWCIYEQRAVGPAFVVNPNQTRGLCDQTRPHITDHFGTAKPKDKNDPLHLTLRSWIKEALAGPQTMPFLQDARSHSTALWSPQR